MIATSFNEENDVLGKPPGVSDDQCGVLSVWRGQHPNGLPCVVSCWKLTAEELAEITRTGRVWVLVIGETMPPILPVGVSPFKEPQ